MFLASCSDQLVAIVDGVALKGVRTNAERFLLIIVFCAIYYSRRKPAMLVVEEDTVHTPLKKLSLSLTHNSILIPALHCIFSLSRPSNESEINGTQ